MPAAISKTRLPWHVFHLGLTACCPCRAAGSGDTLLAGVEIETIL